jgi:uncharacterized repeat protein (TIGR01451 family)
MRLVPALLSLCVGSFFVGAANANQSLTTVGVSKQFTPAVIKPGERSRLRITFTNGSTLSASNLSVVDNLPAGVVVPAGPNPITTCPGAVITTPTATRVQVDGGSLGATTGLEPARCYAELDVLASTQGDFVNTIAVGGFTARVGGAQIANADPATAILRAKTPVVIHQAIASLTLDPGSPAGFTTGEASRLPGASAPLVIRLTNPNPTPLTQAQLTNSLPIGLVVAPTPAAATTCPGATVTAIASSGSIQLTGATIAANGFCTLTVNVLSNTPSAYTNTIESAALLTFEGVTNEERTRARLQVLYPPGLFKQFSPPVIPPGGTTRLTINVGNVNVANTTLTANLIDTLPTTPAPMVVAAVPNVTTSCPGGTGIVLAPAGSPTVRMNNGAVVPSAGCRIEVNVTAPLPGSYLNNLPAGALQTNRGSNEQPATATLRVSTLGFISGKVFFDRLTPFNGIFAPGQDPPISGVEIQLRSGPTVGGALLFTTHTDAAGNYLFSDLPAGTYSVLQNGQPAGTLNNVTLAGTIVGIGASSGSVGVASNPTATTSQIVGIVLGNDAGDAGRVSGSINNNFSEVRPVSVSGTVFRDVNNNGVQQGADLGLLGVPIVLTGTGWQGQSVSASTTTDANGNYSFINLPQPNGSGYTITQPLQPINTLNGITTAGPAVANGVAGVATTVSTVPSRISGIVMPPGSNSVGNNFAEIPTDRRVSGRVFRDFDDNGIFNGADLGISGQTLELTGSDINGNPVSLTTTTLGDGTYVFTSVAQSNGVGYTITQPNQPADTQSGITTAGSTGGTATLKTSVPSRIAGLNLAGLNTVSADNNFGELDSRGPPPPGGGPDQIQSIPTLSGWAFLSLLALIVGLGCWPVRQRIDA